MSDPLIKTHGNFSLKSYFYLRITSALQSFCFFTENLAHQPCPVLNPIIKALFQFLRIWLHIFSHYYIQFFQPAHLSVSLLNSDNTGMPPLFRFHINHHVFLWHFIFLPIVAIHTYYSFRNHMLFIYLPNWKYLFISILMLCYSHILTNFNTQCITIIKVQANTIMYIKLCYNINVTPCKIHTLS